MSKNDEYFGSLILSRKISSHIELRLEDDQTNVYIESIRLYPAYIRDNELIEYFYNGDLMNELYSLLSDTPLEFKYMASFLMFNFDLIFLSQVLEPSVVRSKNFDNLIKTIKRFIIEYKKLV